MNARNLLLSLLMVDWMVAWLYLTNGFFMVWLCLANDESSYA
jgi:hypothetical protein